ncbi:hypothetical protein HYU07_01385 [Candidatus Woesearchaeota archaeon]|nr:hypothetical protein [Candidatus Woesearchaeota archaeon]
MDDVLIKIKINNRAINALTKILNPDISMPMPIVALEKDKSRGAHVGQTEVNKAGIIAK